MEKYEKSTHRFKKNLHRNKLHQLVPFSHEFYKVTWGAGRQIQRCTELESSAPRSKFKGLCAAELQAAGGRSWEPSPTGSWRRELGAEPCSCTQSAVTAASHSLHPQWWPNGSGHPSHQLNCQAKFCPLLLSRNFNLSIYRQPVCVTFQRICKIVPMDKHVSCKILTNSRHHAF